MSEMTLKTNYRDITYEVNPGVAHQIDSLVSQHPDTKIKVEGAASTQSATLDELQRSRDMAVRQRDRARADRDRYMQDLETERDNGYARSVMMHRLLRGIVVDLREGVHPGSILTKVKDELETQSLNGFTRVPDTGYMSGLYSERIGTQRRQAQNRALLDEAYSEPVTAPVPDEPLPAPDRTLADWERELIDSATSPRWTDWHLAT